MAQSSVPFADCRFKMTFLFFPAPGTPELLSSSPSPSPTLYHPSPRMPPFSASLTRFIFLQVHATTGVLRALTTLFSTLPPLWPLPFFFLRPRAVLMTMPNSCGCCCALPLTLSLPKIAPFYSRSPMRADSSCRSPWFLLNKYPRPGVPGPPFLSVLKICFGKHYSLHCRVLLFPDISKISIPLSTRRVPHVPEPFLGVHAPVCIFLRTGHER